MAIARQLCNFVASEELRMGRWEIKGNLNPNKPGEKNRSQQLNNPGSVHARSRSVKYPNTIGKALELVLRRKKTKSSVLKAAITHAPPLSGPSRATLESLTIPSAPVHIQHRRL